MPTPDSGETMARKAHLEAAVLEVLWDADGWLTPRRVLEELSTDRQVAYTTVMTVLVRLWKKGTVVRRREGRAFEYRPRLPRSETAALRMEEILQAAGDRSLTLSRFLEALSESERRDLRNMLE